MDAQESQIYFATCIAIILMACIISYFIFSAIKHHKKVLETERKNATSEIAALEKDRARIAADLHDDLAPMLSAIRMRINSFELSDQEDLLQLQKTNQNIDEMASRMREISFDLMPTSLLERGLITAIHELIGYFSKNDKLKIKLISPEQSIALKEQAAIHIYRIIHEIIHNTIKHAQASELYISLEKQEGTILLSTRDNGIGFDYTEKKKHGSGLGLSSLENRVRLLKGELTVTSKTKQGTAYRIEIPLN
jgi:two-component system, NarL family, sensor kinase